MRDEPFLAAGVRDGGYLKEGCGSRGWEGVLFVFTSKKENGRV